MNPQELTEQLAQQTKDLEALQATLADSQFMNQEATQTFIFDLKDYLDSLTLVTDLVPNVKPQAIELKEISRLLAAQYQTLIGLIEQLKAIEDGETDSTFFQQSAGEIRRTIGSLQGIAELNTMMLQDNLTFQRQVENVGGLGKASVQSKVVTEKKGFFQRLFGKN